MSLPVFFSETIPSLIPVPGASAERSADTVASVPARSPALHRPIQSFVLRQGRLTQAQHRALEVLEPLFRVPVDQPLEASRLFARTAPLVVEIGFGSGDSLAAMAKAHPGMDFIGIEVHRPGVGHLLLQIESLELSNVRVHRGDAVAFLREYLPDGCLDVIQIFFPDPWHKKKHHKRRLLNPAFVELAAGKLRPGGRLHVATDWEHYARYILDVLDGSPHLFNPAGEGRFVERPEQRPLTRFEQRGIRLGHGVWDIIYLRQ